MTTHPESDLDAPDVPALPPLQPRLPSLPAPAPKPPPAPGVGFQVPVQFLPPIAMAPRPKRRRWGSVLLALVLLVGAGGAVYMLVLRDTDKSGDAAATDPTAQPEASAVATADGLPDLHFDRPVLTSAAWTETVSSLEFDDNGVLQVSDSVFNVSADYTQSTTRVDATGLGDGVVSTVIITPDYAYSPGDAFGAPWTRTPRAGDSTTDSMNNAGYLDIYQDRVTERMRAGATNVSTTSAVVDGLTLTTYAFDVDARDLDGSGQTQIPSFISQDLLVGHMEVTIDETGLVRRWSFSLDEALMREAATAAKVSLPLKFGAAITSVNQPVDVALPTDFVDTLSDSCRADKKTLEVATEAWYAQTGSATAPTEADLVPGYLRREIDTYDLVDGAVVAVPGGGCE